jgi:opacity protein-like surface antigen
MKITFRRAILGGIATIAMLTPSAAEAQIRRVSGSDTRQSFGVNLGGFFPKGEDSRVDNDVLIVNRNSLLFDIGDFRGINFGAEYLYGVTDHIEAGLDVSFYQRTVPSIYADVVHDDLREIEQDLKLRILPVTASVRFIPTGRNATVQPYIGIGAGLLNWRYSETGEFVDFSDNSIFRDRFVASGREVAPVVIGGLRFMGADVWTVGGEVRWQKADADTGGRDAGFLADRIDLGGWTANFNVHFRF